MTDREKVIKGLECCSQMNGYACRKCPYASECVTGEQEYQTGTSHLASDALALLKEQEAVEPTLIREGRNKYYNDYVCTRCDNEVAYEQNYCSECGIPFLWKGR